MTARFGDVTAAVDNEMTSVMKGVGRMTFTNVSQNRVLIGIVDQMLPNGSYAWTAVANAYQEAS